MLYYKLDSERRLEFVLAQMENFICHTVSIRFSHFLSINSHLFR